MKERLRKKFLKKRNKLSKSLIKKRSIIIFNKLINSKSFKKAKCVMFYVSFGSEVNTQLMIKMLFEQISLTRNSIHKKIICVPIVKKNRLIPSIIQKFSDLNKKNGFGILEPSKIKKLSKNKIDIAIVPGIVFDKRCHRIGYGKGYYDRFLKNFNGTKIGLAFRMQITKKIEHKTHDVRLDYILTD